MEFKDKFTLDGMLRPRADTPEQAQANALRTMGRKLILQARDIQVDDIRIKSVERANLFISHADSIGATQAAIDADTAFSVVPLRGRAGSAFDQYRIG